MTRRAALVFSSGMMLISGCHHDPSTRKEEPAPSSSVITLGVGFATCDDVAICERGCDAGLADPCRRLAASYALGSGVDADETRAAALYDRACDLKDPSACVSAGQMYEYAHGVAKDDARAARYYERSCDARWAAGCYNLAIMYENGRGVAAGPKQGKVNSIRLRALPGPSMRARKPTRCTRRSRHPSSTAGRCLRVPGVS